MEDSEGRRNHPCDQCRRRKVRCNYLAPCDRCQEQNISCTSTAPRKKRGRKPGSGVVIEQLREETNRTDEDGGMSMPPTSAPHGNPPGISEVMPGASGSYATPETIMETGSLAGSPYQQRPTYLQHGSFYTFDDFAQSLLNPSSSNAWNTDMSPLNQSRLENQGGAASITSQPMIHSHRPHSFSTVSAQTPVSPEAFAFETNDVVERGVALFFQHMYPTYPILVETQIHSWLLSAPPPGQADVCMLWALTAMTLLHVDDWTLTLEQRMNMARSYIKLCREQRLSGTFPESPSYADVVCSLFLALAYFELRSRTTSWVYVREAVTLAMAAGLHDAATDISLSPEERLQQQRCYALLFITERGASILDNLPVSIMVPATLSDGMLPDETPGTSLGLQRLNDLFSLLDLSFVRLWNDLSPHTGEDYGYIEFAHLQDRLRQPMDLRGVSDIQRADVLVTQQWLRLVFWQAELRLGLISATATDPAFTYEYPMEIASSLCDVVKSLPPVAIQVHGLGIFKKQFEIAYSLLDSLTFSRSNHASTYYETLRYLLFSLSASPTSQQIYVKTLEKKIGSEQKYRSMSNVELLRIDGSNRPRQSRARSNLSTNRPLAEGLS